MKKIFSLSAIMLGVMALVCTGCSKEEPQPSPSGVTLTMQSTASVQVGKTTTIVATINPAATGAVVSFTSSNPAIATVAGTLQSCTITGVAKGTATITASYSGATATCTVTVTEGGGGGGSYPVLEGTDYYAIFLDGTTAGSLGTKVKYNFYTNNENRWLYVWENTFVGADPSGNNPFDLPEGWICMKQSNVGWAGAGFCFAIKGEAGEYKAAADEDLAALNSLATNITDYSKWDLVISMKKSQKGVGYECHLIGGNTVSGGQTGEGIVTINDSNCPADDEWHTISFPLNTIKGLEFGQWDNYGSNLFTVVANPYVENGDLNLGAAFIYKAR